MSGCSRSLGYDFRRDGRRTARTFPVEPPPAKGAPFPNDVLIENGY